MLDDDLYQSERKYYETGEDCLTRNFISILYIEEFNTVLYKHVLIISNMALNSLSCGANGRILRRVL
jgi:hypothetical protein